MPHSALAPAGEDDLDGLGAQRGGVMPFTERADVTVVVDSSVPGMGRVYCGSGRADRTLWVDVDDIVALSPQRVLAPIGKSA
ncbi:YbaK/EbsC family protein [Streptomyces gamaensis]|uniref:YbaK/EbsC family protein n=1 Tax=Streptomyces gamaensis TaxID=1763542 RepID=A0ABW0YWG5_9ACTN